MIARLLGVRIFDVEASSRCNVKCSFCPRERLPETGLMTQEVYARLLSQLDLRATDTLSFVGIGEPLLNPLLPSFLMQAKVRHPRVRTWVTTNGTLLDESRLTGLLQARLDTLDISVNGTNSASYETMVRGARFDRTVANVVRAVRTIEKTCCSTRLQLNFVSTGDLVRDEQARNYWRSRGVSRFRVQPLHSRAGAVAVPGGRTEGMGRPAGGGPAPAMRCEVFELFTFFTWRGDVLYCCNDLGRRDRLGSIGRDAWSAIERRKRSIAVKGPWPAFCARCTSPQRHALFAYVDRQLRSEIGALLRKGAAKLLGLGGKASPPVLPEWSGPENPQSDGSGLSPSARDITVACATRKD